MTRCAVFVASVGVLCLTVSVDARAEPIRISGGTLDFNGVFGAGPSQPGFLSIVGNRGFSVAGIVESGETRIDPVANCFPCPAGSTISLGAEIMGSGFWGSVTLDGQTHTDVNGGFSPDSLALELSGTIDLPAWRNAPVTISAPFEATGTLSAYDPNLLLLPGADPRPRSGDAESCARPGWNMGPELLPLRLHRDANARTGYVHACDRSARLGRLSCEKARDRRTGIELSTSRKCRVHGAPRDH